MRSSVKQTGGAIPMYRGAAFQFGNMLLYRGMQYGGFIPVYAGVPYQYGNGLGDILKGIGRFLIPIISPIAQRAASSFFESAVSGIREGKSIKEAAKGAIAPTVSETIDAAKSQVMKRIQRGRGRVYKRKTKDKHVKIIKRSHKRKSSRKPKQAKRFRDLKENF